MAGVLDSLLEGFAAEQQDPFPDHPFTTGDQVRVSVGNGAPSVVGRVMRPHGGPKPTHAVISPEGGGAHVLAPVGQVKLNTPAQHAAARKRQERDQARQEDRKAHAAWMAAKPGGPAPVRLREAFAPAPAPAETPAQSQAIGARQVAQAQSDLRAGWTAAKHPRGQGGRFGYTTGGKRAKRSSSTAPRTLHQGTSGALVRSIQRQLGLPADGQYGPNTKAAIVRFQQQHKLLVDGIVGRQTLAALRGQRPGAPGAIGSRQARVVKPKATRVVKPKVKRVPAPVRMSGGVLV